ncbi:MAG: SixA phosphatase family protein [Bdellovibrio sp.]|jgi:broad specificity phosphatase PhoE
MQIFLFRHAERENSGAGNPPLSARGLKQARELAKLRESGAFPPAGKVLVSPKIRTQQTFAPLAESLELQLAMTPELDERLSSESASQFASRVKRFLGYLERQTGVLYVCTHLDWLEEAMIVIPSDTDLLAEKFQTWAPAQFIEFDVREGLWQVLKSGRIEC